MPENHPHHEPDHPSPEELLRRLQEPIIVGAGAALSASIASAKEGTARGSVTMALHDFSGLDLKNNTTAAYLDYLETAPVDLRTRRGTETGHYRGGILALTLVSVFKGEIARVMHQLDEAWQLKENFQYLKREARKDPAREELSRILRSNVLDIYLLLNSSGCPMELSLLIEEFMEEQKGKGAKVTTIASEQAGSGAAYLFGCGDERYAFPDTRFMLHVPFDYTKNPPVPLDVRAPENESPLAKYVRGKYRNVLDRLSAEPKTDLKKRFDNAMQTPEGTIYWPGRESPGHVTRYLDPDRPLPEQLSEALNTSVNLQSIADCAADRFALEGEVWRRFTKKGRDVRVSFAGSSIKVDKLSGEFKKDEVRNAITEICQEYGLRVQ